MNLTEKERFLLTKCVGLYSKLVRKHPNLYKKEINLLRTIYQKLLDEVPRTTTDS